MGERAVSRLRVAAVILDGVAALYAVLGTVEVLAEHSWAGFIPLGLAPLLFLIARHDRRKARAFALMLDASRAERERLARLVEASELQRSKAMWS